VENINQDPDKFVPVLPDEVKKKISVEDAEFPVKTFKKGDVIFKHGDKPAFLIYINSGIVKVFNVDKNDKEQLMHVLGEDDFYGIIALLMNNPSSSTCIAGSDCTLTLVAADHFEPFVLKHPAIGLKMIKFLAFKLSSTNIELRMWPEEHFKKFLVINIEDDLPMQEVVQKMFAAGEYRLMQYTSIADMRADLLTLVKLARKYLGVFLVSDGELDDGTFCDVFSTLESIIRLNWSVVSILTGKIDTSDYAAELVEKYNTTYVKTDIVISKFDKEMTANIGERLKEIFYSKYESNVKH